MPGSLKWEMLRIVENSGPSLCITCHTNRHSPHSFSDHSSAILFVRAVMHKTSFLRWIWFLCLHDLPSQIEMEETLQETLICPVVLLVTCCLEKRIHLRTTFGCTNGGWKWHGVKDGARGRWILFGRGEALKEGVHDKDNQLVPISASSCFTAHIPDPICTGVRVLDIGGQAQGEERSEIGERRA